MSPRRRFRLTAVALTLGAAPPASLAAQANWDGLGTGNYQNTPVPYVGYNFFYGNGTFGTGSALQWSTLGADCRSASNCAYNANGDTPIRIEALTTSASDAFTFDGWLKAGYPGFGPAAVDVIAQGFVGSSSTPAFTMLFALSPNGFTELALTSTSVNKILLTPANAGGQPAAGYMLLDDVALTRATAPTTSTPEPATLALVGGGLVMVGAAARRRRTA